MTAEQREKYLNRMKECYKKNHGYYVSRKQLLEENKKLREELGEYKKMFEDHLKECYIKNTAEFMDKKFTLENGFTEESTPQ